jgi:hypothetical protein
MQNELLASKGWFSQEIKKNTHIMVHKVEKDEKILLLYFELTP